MGREEGGGGSRKEGIEGEVSRGVPGRGKDSHESAERAQCDFIASREEAPGAGGRSECSSRSGRSEPWPSAPGRARDRAQGRPGRSGMGWRGEAARGPGKLRAEKPTSPLLLLHPHGRQFPPRPETPRCARSACRWRCRGALGALLGVGGGAQPQSCSGLGGARAQKGAGRGGGGGEGKAGGAARTSTGPRTLRSHRSGWESREIRPAALAPRRGADSCVLLNSPLGHLPGPAELGAAHLQRRDCGLGAVFPLPGWLS